MNATATDAGQVHTQLSNIIGTEVDESTTVFPAFYTIYEAHDCDRRCCTDGKLTTSFECGKTHVSEGNPLISVVV